MSEPLLRGNEIQGDSLAGFRKDHVALLFLRFNVKKINVVKKWLASLAPRLATLNAVAQFNDAFRTMRKARSGEGVDGGKAPDPDLWALWMNIAFTSQGLTKLIGKEDVRTMETAFVIGAEARAGEIGDPTNGAPRSPLTWKVGSGRKVPDAMLNIAADVEKDLKDAVKKIEKELRDLPGRPITIIHRDRGDTTIAPQRGHEHFGFKDGISQPGVRGLLDTPTRPFLTPRLIHPSDPLGSTFAAPGMPLIHPGEFVLGYPRQSPDNPAGNQEESATRFVPKFAVDGSYVVYRRLNQDVEAFEKFIELGTERLNAEGFSVDREQFGAMCVGRWKDGVPLARSPLHTDPGIAADREAQQSFFFWKDTPPVRWENPATPTDHFRPAEADGDGQRCPISAHIRKINPRDEATDIGHGARTLRRRVIRRGITFGPSYDKKPKEERGLLFICYQASITDQFEFLWRVWANKEHTPRGDAGFDPIIGQAGNRPPETRVANFVQGEKAAAVPIPYRFVISTGAAYLFAPSISAIRDVLAAE